jgi:hypothetical protein
VWRTVDWRHHFVSIGTAVEKRMLSRTTREYLKIANSLPM